MDLLKKACLIKSHLFRCYFLRSWHLGHSWQNLIHPIVYVSHFVQYQFNSITWCSIGPRRCNESQEKKVGPHRHSLILTRNWTNIRYCNCICAWGSFDILHQNAQVHKLFRPVCWRKLRGTEQSPACAAWATHVSKFPFGTLLLTNSSLQCFGWPALRMVMIMPLVVVRAKGA